MGRNGESKLPRFQKYKEHEKRGLGALTIELENWRNPSYGGEQNLVATNWEDDHFCVIFPFYFI